ncbi:MAG: DNA helicase RecG, partial [Spirochaetaceae bacterium]
MYLDELTAPIVRLKGVGPKRADDFSKIGLTQVRDLLLHIPREYEDRMTPVPFRAVRGSGNANTVAEVVAHDYVGRPPQHTLKVHLDDGTGTAALVCFGRNFLERSLPVGKKIRVFGAFAPRYGELQASQFEFEPLEAPSRAFGKIVPLYPLAGSLTHAAVRTAVESALTGYA